MARQNGLYGPQTHNPRIFYIGLRAGRRLNANAMHAHSIRLSITILLMTVYCSSGPKPIPFAATRTLAASSPTIAALEQSIATKKAEQDLLEQKLAALEAEHAQKSEDAILKQKLDKAQRESALCQAELAALIGRHQLESAKVLKRTDIAEREKIVAGLDETVAERRKDLAGGK